LSEKKNFKHEDTKDAKNKIGGQAVGDGRGLAATGRLYFRSLRAFVVKNPI